MKHSLIKFWILVAFVLSNAFCHAQQYLIKTRFYSSWYVGAGSVSYSVIDSSSLFKLTNRTFKDELKQLGDAPAILYVLTKYGGCYVAVYSDKLSTYSCLLLGKLLVHYPDSISNSLGNQDIFDGDIKSLFDNKRCVVRKMTFGNDHYIVSILKLSMSYCKCDPIGKSKEEQPVFKNSKHGYIVSMSSKKKFSKAELIGLKRIFTLSE